MTTQMIGSCFAIALGLFACAAPAEEEGAPVAKADGPAEEHTGETSSALAIRYGEGCALTCSGGNQTCCCSVGQKCESGATYCVCKPADDTRFTMSFGEFVAQ